MMPRVCLTNDDGFNSQGLQELARAIRSEMEVVIVVPDGQRSATGKGLTLNQPIRIAEREVLSGIRLVVHTGTPADSVIIAKSFCNNIDLIVSGINSGANLGYQSMFTSGTVGAVFEAAFVGVPALAVSQVVRPEEWFAPSGVGRDYTRICEMCMDVIRRVLKRGLPEGVDALNLNFPGRVTEKSRIVVTRPTRVRMANDLERRVDPNGSAYYWIRGYQVESGPGTDAYEVFENGNVSLSPIVIESVGDRELAAVREFMGD